MAEVVQPNQAAHVSVSASATSAVEAKHPKYKSFVSKMFDIVNSGGLVPAGASVNQKSPFANEKQLNSFFNTASHAPLFVYYSAENDGNNNGLICDLQPPPAHDQRFAYFARTAVPQTGPADHFSKLVRFGIVNSQAQMKSLLHIVESVYSPIILNDQKFSSGMAADMKTHLHRFLSNFTDSVFRNCDGKTVLYIPPKEKFENNAETSGGDIVNHLEMIVTYWTRQIKSVIANSSMRKSSENSLIDEVEFWKRRFEDLDLLNSQLDKIEVKEIIRILQENKRACAREFLKLSVLISDGAKESRVNVSVLNVIVDPYQSLMNSDLKSMPNVLIKLMCHVSVVIQESPYYHTADKVSTLYRKMGYDIVVRCRNLLSIPSLLLGQTSQCIDSLDGVMEVCNAWVNIFSAFQERQKQSNPLFNVDATPIFAHTQAFIQRATDLLEVIRYQKQFSRFVDGVKSPIPSFGNTSGPKILKSLQDIDKVFTELLAKLLSRPDIVFDVNNTEWHLVFGDFRRKVKDLELRFLSTVSLAFSEANTVEKQVHALRTFKALSSLPSLKTIVEKRANDVAKTILDSMGEVKSTYERYRLTPEILRSHPDYAGAAYWALTLRRRVESLKSLFEVIEKDASMYTADQINSLTVSLTGSLDEFSVNTFKEWCDLNNSQLNVLLMKPLLAKNDSGHLVVNFPISVLRVLTEGSLWNKLKMDLPNNVQEVLAKKNDINTLRQQVLSIMREYNEIVDSIPAECLDIFQEKLKAVDKKLQPGLTALKWTSKGSFEGFFGDFRKSALILNEVLSSFFGFCSTIEASLNEIADTSLFFIETKQIYALDEFVVLQEQNQKKVRQKFTQIHSTIQSEMAKAFDLFKNDPDIGKSWVSFISRVDKLIENAVRASIRKSLQDISRAVNGESKAKGESIEVQPVFRLDVVLENQKVEYSPGIQTLEERINTVARNMISAVSDLPRLVDILIPEDSPLKSDISKKINIQDVIVQEEDIIKIFAAIQAGMSATSVKCQTYARTWDGYREIWEINKDAFIRRYAKLKPPNSTFDADIGRYHEVSNNAQKEETFSNVDFVRLDCSSLKRTIAMHCSTWQEKLSTLLASNASTDLAALYGFIDQKKHSLDMIPTDLDTLADFATLINSLKDDLPNIQGRFGPINEQYQVLTKYEVTIKDDEHDKLMKMEQAFEEFLVHITNAEKRLEEAKLRFRNNLLVAVNSFGKSCVAFKEDFSNNGPFKFSTDFNSVNKNIDVFAKRVADLYEQERSLKKGLSLFRIDQVASKELEWCSKSLDVLKLLWLVVQEWSVAWEACKINTLSNINRDYLGETFRIDFQQKISRFAKEAKGWDVFDHVDAITGKIVKLLPVLAHLQNNGLKQRHWSEISALSGKTCNPFDNDFNLEKMIGYGLDQFLEQISAIAADI